MKIWRDLGKRKIAFRNLSLLESLHNSKVDSGLILFETKSTAGRKKIRKFFLACFSHFKHKTGHFKVFSIQKETHKHGSVSLQFVTRAAKNLWRAAVWPCLIYKLRDRP